MNPKKYTLSAKLPMAQLHQPVCVECSSEWHARPTTMGYTARLTWRVAYLSCVCVCRLGD